MIQMSNKTPTEKAAEKQAEAINDLAEAIREKNKIDKLPYEGIKGELHEINENIGSIAESLAAIVKFFRDMGTDKAGTPCLNVMTEEWNPADYSEPLDRIADAFDLSGYPGRPENIPEMMYRMTEAMDGGLIVYPSEAEEVDGNKEKNDD